jgi:hypothetical protein
MDPEQDKHSSFKAIVRYSAFALGLEIGDV